MLTELRDELQEVQLLLAAGETAAAAARLDTALQQLATHRLLDHLGGGRSAGHPLSQHAQGAGPYRGY